MRDCSVARLAIAPMEADWRELDAACDGACPVKIVGNVLVGDHLEYIISLRAAAEKKKSS